MQDTTQTLKTYRQRSHTWANILSCIPSVRAIALSGSMASNTATEVSDIDLFIVTAPGTLYITRVMVTGLCYVCGVLKRPHKHAGRICPNHFVAEDILELEEKTKYVAQLVSNMQPLYDYRTSDDHSTWHSFIAKHEKLLQTYQLHAKTDEPLVTHTDPPALQQMLGFILGFVRQLEPKAKQWTQWKIYHKNKTTSTGVVLADKEIRLHES